MDVLDKYGMRATVALNSDVCAAHPRIIEEGNKRKWEWMGHNESNTRRLDEAPPGEEGNIIRRTFGAIEKASGQRPVGWLSSGLAESWNSVDLLAANGCEYVCDWCNDDQPYEMQLEGGRHLLSVPYTVQLNDKSSIEHRFNTGDEFRQMICDTFDVLYREGEESGRVMAISLHPYLIGVPHRIGALDAALKYVCKHKKVWKATGSEIARHYREQMKNSAASAKAPSKKRK
jgi:allantoinase